MLTLDPEVFDAQTVQSLRELDPDGASGLLERLFKTFGVTTRGLLVHLQQAHARGDAAMMRDAAHSLKSSCASVGALRLSDHAARMEAVLRSGAVKPEHLDLDEFHREAGRVLDSLEHNACRETDSRECRDVPAPARSHR